MSIKARPDPTIYISKLMRSIFERNVLNCNQCFKLYAGSAPIESAPGYEPLPCGLPKGGGPVCLCVVLMLCSWELLRS